MKIISLLRFFIIAMVFLVALLAMVITGIFVIAASKVDSNTGKTWLLSFVESRMSTPDRKIHISNIDGIFSSHASIELITISDREGIWLQINNIQLNWNRLALLGGQISINSLLAEKIELLRKPLPELQNPAAVSSGFSVHPPPVAVIIDSLRVQQFLLDQRLSGSPATVALEGRISLGKENLDSLFIINRIDGSGGTFRLVAAYSKEQNLNIDLELSEPDNGIIASFLKIDKRPSINLYLKGEGTSDNIDIDLGIDISDAPALNGHLALRAADDGRSFHLAVDGSADNLVPDIYRPFLGGKTRLDANGALKSAGGIRVDQISLEGAAVHMSGQLETAQDGFLRQLVLDGNIASVKKRVFIFPDGNEKTSANQIKLHITYGMPDTENWAGKLEFHDLETKDLRAKNLVLDLEGVAENLDNPANRHLGLAIKGEINEITSPNPEIVRATGSHIVMNMDMDWHPSLPVIIKNMDIHSRHMSFFSKGKIQNLIFQGTFGAKARDIAPFSALANLSLSGQAAVTAHGTASFADGTFDFNINGTSGKLRSRNNTMEHVLKNNVAISGGIARDISGALYFRSFRMGNKEMEITADGRLARNRPDIKFRFQLSDMALISRDARGSVLLKGTAHEHDNLVTIDLDGSVTDGIWQGRKLDNTMISFSGALNSSSPETDYMSGILKGNCFFGDDRISLFAALHADKSRIALDSIEIRAGQAKFSGNLAHGRDRLTEGKMHLDAEDLSTLSALAFGNGKGSASIDMILDTQSGKQNVMVEADIRNFDVADIRIPELQMQTALYDLFGILQADSILHSSDISVSGHSIKSVHASSKMQNQDSYFTIDAVFENTESMAVSGFLSCSDTKSWQLLLDKANLHYQNMNMDLVKPSKILFQENINVSISDLAMNVDNGSFTVNGTVGNVTNLAIDIKNLPLSLAGLLYPDSDPEGLVNGAVDITGNRTSPSINFDIKANRITTTRLRKNLIKSLDLSAKGKIDGQILDLNTHLSGSGLSVITQGRIFLAEKKLALDLTLEDTPLSLLGRAAQNQGLDGVISGTASISGTFSDPEIRLSVEGKNITENLLAKNGIAPLRFSAAGIYTHNILNLDFFELHGAKKTGIKVSGHIPVSGDGLDLRVDGSVPLVLLTPFFPDPHLLFSGFLTVNARIRGSFQQLRPDGSFSIADGWFINTSLNMSLNAITVAGKFHSDRIVFDRASAVSTNGGTLNLAGWISTNIIQGLPLNLAFDLDHLRYNDRNMLAATLHGRVTLTGQLMRNPVIAGDIVIEQAEINIPDNPGGATFIDIRHRNLTPPVVKTLERAGAEARKSITPQTSAHTPVPELDLQVRASNRIFIRGRGLDAELRGQLHLAGPITDIHPVGSLHMFRCRFEILAQRLSRCEGQVTMTGNMNPALDFTAVSDGNDITVTVRINGTPKNLQVALTSQPQLPQDEALAQLIFKRSLRELSPFQLARLVDAIAELSGITNRSVFERLRSDTGLDKLDITTDKSGNTGIEAGRYIRNKIYLGVEASSTGKTKGTVNLDINRNLRAKGAIGSDSSSNIGIFYERDY